MAEMPTPEELRSWKKSLQEGYAIPGMLDRVIEAYEMLWNGVGRQQPEVEQPRLPF